MNSLHFIPQVVVGFESGFVAVEDCNMANQSHESVFSTRLFPGGLSSLAVSPLLSRAAALFDSLEVAALWDSLLEISRQFHRS